MQDNLLIISESSKAAADLFITNISSDSSKYFKSNQIDNSKNIPYFDILI